MKANIVKSSDNQEYKGFRVSDEPQGLGYNKKNNASFSGFIDDDFVCDVGQHPKPFIVSEPPAKYGKIEKEDFIYIPYNVLKNKNLSPIEKLILSKIHAYCQNAKKHYIANNSDIANYFYVSKELVKKSTRNLVKLGVIEIEPVYKSGTKYIIKNKYRTNLIADKEGLRLEKTTYNFFKISKTKKVKYSAMFILSLVFSFTRDDKKFYASNSYIADLIGISENTVENQFVGELKGMVKTKVFKKMNKDGIIRTKRYIWVEDQIRELL